MAQQLIEWTQELETGVLWQDLQHKELIGNINALYAAILQKRGPEALQRIIAFLDGYVQNHFLIEEQYMAAFNDPGLDRNTQEHRRFAQNVRELSQADAAPGQLAAEALCFDLFEWFKNHIIHTDKALAQLLKKHAVQ